jgi:hypothetical protein
LVCQHRDLRSSNRFFFAFSSDSDDDRPYSSGSLGEEDRLVIAEDFLVKKEDPDGLNLNLKKEVTVKKERKKQNRFNGLTEEELSKRLLPDLIAPNLDILIVSFLMVNHPKGQTISLFTLRSRVRFSVFAPKFFWLGITTIRLCLESKQA